MDSSHPGEISPHSTQMRSHLGGIIFLHVNNFFQAVPIRQDCSFAEAFIRRCSVKKIVPKNFTKFTGKHLCQGLSFDKIVGLRPASAFSLDSVCFYQYCVKKYNSSYKI